MYIQPRGDAVNFALSRSGYIQPPNTAVPFELTRDGSIQPSIVPGVIVSIATPWRPAPGRKYASVAARFGASDVIDRRMCIDTGSTARALNIRRRLAYDATRRLDDQRRIRWNEVGAKDSRKAMVHENALQRDIERLAVVWEQASFRVERKWSAPFLVLTPFKDRTQESRFRSSDLLSQLRTIDDSRPPLPPVPQVGIANLEFSTRWDPKTKDIYELAGTFPDFAIQPKDFTRCFLAGQGRPVEVKKRIPWGPAGARDTTLEFDYDDFPGAIDLENTFVIPSLRFYVVANTAKIVRVSDGVDVPASQVSLSISVDQFTWQCRATLAKRSAKALVEGTDGEPVEVDVHINGNVWRILVDFWDERRAWESDSISIAGRSRSAFLAAPYAAPRDFVETSGLLAQQLADQELPFGWDLEWNATDWFVPGGAWRYQGLTPVQAIARLAEAAGAFITPHAVDDKLFVESLYPAAPWDLINLAPDIQLPFDVMLQRDSRKIPGSGANGVFVFGGSVSPFHAEVIRRQSNGLPLTDQIVNDLVTDPNPARALGTVAMARTGRQAVENYELPLSDPLGGLIPLGSLIEVGGEVGGFFLPDWRGLVRGVSVSAGARRARNGGVALGVRQDIEIVRHFDEPV